MPNTTITTGQLRTVLFATEHSNNPRTLNKFTYAGGKSSYAFGLMQFDVGGNPDARKFLRDNGFSPEEIAKLKEHGTLKKADVDRLSAKLQTIPQDKLDAFTNSQLQNSIAKVDNLISMLRMTNPPVAQTIADSQELQLRIADYDNQYHIKGEGTRVDRSDLLVRYLSGEPVLLKSGPVRLAPGETLTGEHIRRYIEENIFNVSWANDPATRQDRKPINRPGVYSRERRLEIALIQLSLPPWAESSHAGPAGRNMSMLTPLEQNNGACPPVWLWDNPNHLGHEPPSECDDPYLFNDLF